jgi:hypothetical protein
MSLKKCHVFCGFFNVGAMAALWAIYFEGWRYGGAMGNLF